MKTEHIQQAFFYAQIAIPLKKFHFCTLKKLNVEIKYKTILRVVVMRSYCSSDSVVEQDFVT